MKKFCFACFFILGTLITQAQELISSQGEYLANETLSMSYSVGETVAGTLSNPASILTQGFNQPLITISTESRDISLNMLIEAWPNPANDYVKLSVSGNEGKKISYRLFDLNGKFITGSPLTGNNIEIPFATLAPSVYFLKVYIQDKEIQTFKISKQ
jgi:hypothetical protein